MLEKLQNLKPSEKLLMMAGCFFVFMCAVFNTIVYPLGDKFSDLDTDIDRKSSELTLNQVTIKNGKGIPDEEIEDKVEKSSSHAEAIEDFKGELDELAEGAGIFAPEMSNKEPRESDFSVEYVVELRNFKSNMKQFLSFVHVLQTSSGLLRVEKVHIEPETKDPNYDIKGTMIVAKLMLPPDEVVEEPVE